MTLIGWVQISAVLLATLAAAVPLGGYIARVATGKINGLRVAERGLYRALGEQALRPQGWLAYALSLLAMNAAGFLLLYGVLRLQGALPLNPHGVQGMSPWLAFNTAISFVTNTDWQAYSGEVAASYLSQMLGFTVQNFLSAGTGIAVAFAVTRAFARGGLSDLGNFWQDCVRSILYVLLPLSVVLGLLFIGLGVPQTLRDYVSAHTLEGAQQLIALGPVAFQVAIKHLGTNGGGFFGVNSAHPYEAPSALVLALQIWAQAPIPFALCITFGKIVGAPRQGLILLLVMLAFILLGTLAIYAAETAGNPLLTQLGVAPGQGNMEGKDLRFGQALTALFTATTTGASCGAVNAMLSSFTPLGGLIPLFFIQLGEVLPGGVGSGLYGMLLFALLSVFIAGLMVGRTPEYLGKKIQARELKLAMLALLILPAVILGFSALSMVLPFATASLGNAGPHGLSEMLYAYTSAAGNNGSAFGSIAADTPWLDSTLGIAMMLGRYAYLIPVLALAGGIAAKPRIPETQGSLPTDGLLFAGLLGGVILILGGLQFLPSLALGPLAEHFAMRTGHSF